MADIDNTAQVYVRHIYRNRKDVSVVPRSSGISDCVTGSLLPWLEAEAVEKTNVHALFCLRCYYDDTSVTCKELFRLLKTSVTPIAVENGNNL